MQLFRSFKESNVPLVKPKFHKSVPELPQRKNVFTLGVSDALAEMKVSLAARKSVAKNWTIGVQITPEATFCKAPKPTYDDCDGCDYCNDDTDGIESKVEPVRYIR